jgi:hypothetical protein
MSSDTSKIRFCGVSASKEDVHNAIKTLIKDYFKLSAKLSLII